MPSVPPTLHFASVEKGLTTNGWVIILDVAMCTKAIT